MLEEILVENIKALKKVKLNPHLITVLIGPNGTGKSTVLQALAILKQSRGSNQLRTDGPHVALGTYKDVVHKHEEKGRVHIRLTSSIEEHMMPLVGAGSRFIYAVTFESQGLLNQVGRIVEGDVTQFEGEFIARPVQQLRAEPKRITEKDVTFKLTSGPEVGLPLRIGGSTTPQSVDSDLMEQRRMFENSLRELFSYIDNLLSNTYYVPAVRGFSRPYYPLADKPTQDLSSVGAGDAQAAIVASTLAYRRDLEAKVSGWTQEVLGISIQSVLIPQKQVGVEAFTSSIRVNVVNEGFGVSQLIQPFLQLAIAPSGSLILIEEPEIHVHPAAQSKLCDIIVDTAKQDKKQVFVTTHSEHILTTFLTSIVQGRLKPTDLAVYFFEKEGDVAGATPLSVDRNGRIEGGLRGFFDASLEELGQYMEALSSRKKR